MPFFNLLCLSKFSVTFDLTGGKNDSIWRCSESRRLRVPADAVLVSDLTALDCRRALAESSLTSCCASTLRPRLLVGRVRASGLYQNAVNQKFRKTLWGAILKEHPFSFFHHCLVKGHKLCHVAPCRAAL